MSSGCGDVLSLEDLKTAKKHQIFEAEVITGKTGGSADGADIDYATNQVTGQTQKTLPAVLRDAGFMPASWDFSTGGTLTATDRDLVVYDPVSKAWYAWGGALPKVVPAGTNPLLDANWKPKTDPNLRDDLQATTGASLVGYRLNLNTTAQTLKERLDVEPIYLSSYCKPSKTVDNAVKIQQAINDALSARRPLIIDGQFYSSAALNVVLPPTLDNQYSFVMKGYGRSSSMLLFPAGVRGVVLTSSAGNYSDIVYGAKLKGFSVQCDSYNILTAPTPDATNFTVGFYHKVGLGQCEFEDLGAKGFDYGFRGENTLFLSRIVSCHQLQCYNGLYMSNRGTSNQIDQNYVYGSRGTAYRLTGAYSSFGSLACDRSEGDIYNFSYFSGSIGSLGYESYGIGTVGTIFRAALSYMSIGHLYMQALYGKVTESSKLIEVNASSVSIDSWNIVDPNSAQVPSSGLAGIGINNTNSWLRINKSIVPYKLKTGNPPWSDAGNTAYTEIDGAKFANKWGKGFLGSLTDDVANVTSGSSVVTPLVMFDMFGGARYSGQNGEISQPYGPGINVGQLGVENRPDLHGVAGYVCISNGTNNVDKVLCPIPMIYRGSSRPSQPVVGAIWINPTTNRICHYSGSAWYDAMGTVVP